jgi:O-antigen ligase
MRKAAEERTPEGVAAAWALGFGVVATGLVFDPRVEDAFRLPKELVFRGVAIVLLAIAVFAATRRDGRWRDLLRGVNRIEWILCAAIAVWTTVTALLSTNRLLSRESTITVLATLVIVLSARRLAPSLPLTAMDICLIPALLNALLVMLQELKIWNPFQLAAGGHVASTAFLGNPNDVGTYLACPIIVAAVGTLVLRGNRQRLYALAAVVLLGGLVASATRTAIIALVAGILAFALIGRWKHALLMLAGLALLSGVAFTVSNGMRKNVRKMRAGIAQRRLDIVFSERLVPFLSAMEMIRADPLTGVGPGCFKFHYMDERSVVQQRYPPQWTRNWPQNFGETHNDHLQVAAETGLIGYALFLAAVAYVAAGGLARQADARAPRQRLAHLMRVPLAVTFFVVALAQFPLQIAATRTMYLMLGVLAVGWDASDA